MEALPHVQKQEKDETNMCHVPHKEYRQKVRRREPSPRLRQAGKAYWRRALSRALEEGTVWPGERHR